MAKQVQFSGEYQQVLDQVFHDSTAFDPTEGLPSVEVSTGPEETYPTSNTDDWYHHSSGVFYNFHVSPTSFDLDPYFFFADGFRIQDTKNLMNNDFSLVINDGYGTSQDVNLKKKGFEHGSLPTSVRPAVFKGPMLLSGWGYDIAGLPVPRLRGGYDNNGNAVPNDQVNQDSRDFHIYTPVDRRTWKTGPIDLRWDDERKVWVGGNEFVEGIMATSLAPGAFDNPTYASGQIYRGYDWKFKGYKLETNEMGYIKPEPYGEPQNHDIGPRYELVRIYNRNPDLSVSAGSYFSATKINYEWRIVGAGGGGSCVVGKFKRVNCSASPTDKSIIPIPSTYVKNGKWIMDFGTLKDKYIYYKPLNFFADIIPTDSAGGQLVPNNGQLEIPIISNGLPYYISLVAFENCKFSSNVVTLEVFPDLTYSQYYERVLYKLYDCPTSTECFGTVTDDITGATYYATHPFKFVKHDVRVVACKSSLKISCINPLTGEKEDYSSYVISEVDDCANAGTGESRE